MTSGKRLKHAEKLGTLEEAGSQQSELDASPRRERGCADGAMWIGVGLGFLNSPWRVGATPGGSDFRGLCK